MSRVILAWNDPLRLPQFPIISSGDTASSHLTSLFSHVSSHSHLDHILLDQVSFKYCLPPSAIRGHSSSFWEEKQNFCWLPGRPSSYMRSGFQTEAAEVKNRLKGAGTLGQEGGWNLRACSVSGQQQASGWHQLQRKQGTDQAAPRDYSQLFVGGILVRSLHEEREGRETCVAAGWAGRTYRKGGP